MLPCSRILRLCSLLRSHCRVSRRGFVGIDRPLPDDLFQDTAVVGTEPSASFGALQACETALVPSLDSCSSIEDVCSVFKERRPRLKPAELILLLSRVVQLGCRHRRDAGDSLCELWPRTDFCLVELCGWHGRLDVMRLPSGVGDMYTDVISRIDCFTPTELLYLVRMGTYIRGYHNRILRSHCERILSTCAWRLDHTDLCRSATALACSSDSVPFAKLIGHVCTSRLLEFAPAQRMMVFGALAAARHGATLFLQSCARHALNRDVFTGTDAVKALVCYARKPSACSPAVFENLLRRCVGLDLSCLGPLELCDLLWVTCKYSDMSREMFRRCEPLLLQHCSDLPGRSISMLLWALADSGFESPALLSALESAATAAASSMSPANAALCVNSLSQLKGAGAASDFHVKIEEEVIANIMHFNGLDLAMLAEGYARLGTGSATLHQCVQEYALRYADDLPADCLSKLLWAYGHLVGRESFFVGLQFPLLQRVNQFSAHELCRALWSYAVQRFFDVTFWSSCLTLLDVNQVRGNRRCALLYPALSDLVAVRKELLTADVLRLLNLTKSMFMDDESAAYCAATGERLASALGSLGVTASTAEAFEGFLLDASFEHQGVRHAVLVYTRTNTVDSGSRPSGGMILKARHLRRHGIKVLHVLRDAFMAMDERQRAALLSRQLS
ncbi:hypothetical protein, conserved [Babesia bigemina]|uniref:RAP domain-containing protein n=1 Tax=Babesia bigemina TaxID=5866 RepID=A0A061DBF8_BABBI|nr:hypothetical protein, conserved [Babesia bigemina]CDR95080.1 hypothetical protein, conserved [Babesia bigemina]|eukprot:XP_012767266.1 hypothetical protein, conserved [Babesia bigemina]